MKLIDFSIIFVAVFLVVITTCDLKNDMLYQYKFNTIMLNDGVDEIVVDALGVSFSVENDIIKINKDLLMQCYASELSVLCKDTSIMEEYYKSNSICIVTEDDGFYLWNKGIWTEKIFYMDKGFMKLNETINEHKAYIIGKEIEDRYGITLLLASNEGETFKNKISDYSFVSIYLQNQVDLFDEKYKMMFISGASVKKVDN